MKDPQFSKNTKKRNNDQINTDIFVTDGSWGENVPWEFYLSEVYPPSILCTAVFCIVTYKKKVLLVNHIERGWEIPGGHLDSGEDLIQGIVREVLEETGAIAEKPIYFGYKRISPLDPIPHATNLGKYYPYPHSFIPYYYCEVSEILNINLSKDIESMGIFAWKDAMKILSPIQKNAKIIQFLIDTKKIEVYE